MNTGGLLYWIKEREAIRARRASGAPRPWSSDEILCAWRFTNVRREDDHTTIWIKEHWREPHADDPDLFFAMAVARLVNSPDTLAALGYPVPWDREHFVAVLQALAAQGAKVWGAAYNISNGGKSVPKVVHVAGVLDKLWARRKQLRPRKDDTLLGFYARLRDMDGFGSFMAAQVVADVKYVEPLRSARDWYTFAAPGPGSKRGLNRVLGRPTEATWRDDDAWRAALGKLHEAITPELERMGLGNLHAQDLQSCLCEFDKYERARLGEGTPKQRFVPRNNNNSDAPRDGRAEKSQSAPVDFLEKLRPGGPWVLTAITPDGTTETITARTAAEVDAFVIVNDGKRNLYYHVNPTKREMTKKAAKADIAAVEYLLADLDPDQGEDSAAAKARYLAELDSFEPKPTVIVDSGNGIQTLWRLTKRIELPSEAEAIIADVEARSAALMLRLGAKAGTQNIDRILRLPGTTNLPNKKKRDVGRVPCPTKLIGFNGASYPLDAFPPPGTAGASKRPEPERAAVDVDALPISDRMKDLIQGIDDPEHVYPSRSERVMAVLIAMAGAGCTDDQMAAVMLDKSLPIGEHVRDQPKIVNYLARQIQKARAKAGTSSGQGQRFEIKVLLEDVLKSAADLQSRTFDPLRWIVPKYLPEGLSVLGGRPKIGKSWLALDIAVGVSTGGKCLGEQSEQGDVLALMLEDSDRRLQRRLTRMLGAQIDKWPERLRYTTGFKRLNDGGLDWMREWIDNARKPRLIIIDILERVRQRVIGKGKEKSQYSADYDALAALQELSTEAQLSIFVLHHQRKLGAEDLIDTLSGTLGLGGAVDTVLILGKDQQVGKFLYGRGRDLDEFNISVKQDEQCRWHVLGPRVEVQASPERGKIIKVLARAGKPMNVREISEAVGGKYDNVKNLLVKLHAEGQVERVSTGLYKLPNPQQDMKFDEDVPF